MKKKLFILATIAFFCFSACEKYDNDKELKGKTFTYDNGYYGTYRIKSSYIFKLNGSVTWESTVGNSAKATFEHFKYKLDGSRIEIYHDNSTYWKKEVRNTLSESGTYYGSYIIIRDLKHTVE